VKAALLVAGRDLRGWFATPSGYLILAFALAAEALVFNTVAIGGRRPSTQVMETFLLNAGFVTEAVAVLLAMRSSMAEEGGALLFTAPVGEVAIVAGKFLGAFGLVALTILASLYLPALIFVEGTISLGHIAAGYLGLLLVGAAACAIATLASALTSRPFVAVVLTAALLGALELAWRLAETSEPPWRGWLRSMAPVYAHLTSFRRGILQLSDVVFLLGLSYLALFAATRVIAHRRSS